MAHLAAKHVRSQPIWTAWSDCAEAAASHGGAAGRQLHAHSHVRPIFQFMQWASSWLLRVSVAVRPSLMPHTSHAHMQTCSRSAAACGRQAGQDGQMHASAASRLVGKYCTAELLHALLAGAGLTKQGLCSTRPCSSPPGTSPGATSLHGRLAGRAGCCAAHLIAPFSQARVQSVVLLLHDAARTPPCHALLGTSPPCRSWGT